MNNAALIGFDSWSSFLGYLTVSAAASKTVHVYYRSPLDTSAHMVRVVKVFKNGKVRIDPGHVYADPFTADPAHLSRFFQRPAKPEALRLPDE